MGIKIVFISRLIHHDIFWQNQIRCAAIINREIFYLADSSNLACSPITAYELSQEMNLPFLTNEQMEYVYKIIADSDIYIEGRFEYIMNNLFIFEPNNPDNGIEYKTVKQNIQSLYDLFY